MEQEKYFWWEKTIRDKAGAFVCSTIERATDDEIKKRMKEPCNHGEKDVLNLVYDEYCWTYDYRYCAVCNICLGKV
jgi:hypothetical protein